MHEVERTPVKAAGSRTNREEADDCSGSTKDNESRTATQSCDGSVDRSEKKRLKRSKLTSALQEIGEVISRETVLIGRWKASLILVLAVAATFMAVGTRIILSRGENRDYTIGVSVK
jgi:hypothetical protein